MSIRILIVENEEDADCAQLFVIPDGLNWDDANDQVKCAFEKVRESKADWVQADIAKELASSGILIPESNYSDFRW